jgi:hypothetical protein
VSLLNVAVFSTVYSGDPIADDLHDDAIVSAAEVISDFNSIPAFCWHPYCVGGPVVALIPAVACVPAL